MAVLTLVSGLPRERQSHRGPLTACLCLLLIVMISSSTLLVRRNLDTTIPLHAAAVAIGPGGALVEVATTDALVPGSRVLAGMPDSVNLERAAELWKLQEVQFGMVLGSEFGAVHIARNTWDKHAYTLAPLKRQWGLA